MPEDDRTLGEAFRLIERQEATCERRASRHVDIALWDQRNNEVNDRFGLQGERLGQLEQQLAEHKRDIAQNQKDQTNWRERWRLGLITAIIAPILTAALTVLFVLSGIGRVSP